MNEQVNTLEDYRRALQQAWYEENNKDTSNLSPRDIGVHVGIKVGLLKALNLLDKHEPCTSS